MSDQKMSPADNEAKPKQIPSENTVSLEKHKDTSKAEREKAAIDGKENIRRVIGA